MKIGLIDVDGHNYPNLALMKLSAWHKARGDTVEWWWTDLCHYDLVYMSKVFSDAYTPDRPEPVNADRVIKGGTGYAIELENGMEVYHKERDPALPLEIEHIYPDYSIYPDLTEETAYGFLTRGCPRGCAFCHVKCKEGAVSRQVADPEEFMRGQKNIKLMDPNILACKNREKLLEQLVVSGARVDFNQGLDIRLTDKDVTQLIGAMRVKRVHFAWDNPAENLRPYFERFSRWYRRKDPRRKAVYVLTNFGSTLEEDLYRIYTLREVGFDPYVMIYNKDSAPQETRYLQRWGNNRIIFKSVPDFRDYDHKLG
jgi:hypothetical protein